MPLLTMFVDCNCNHYMENEKSCGDRRAYIFQLRLGLTFHMLKKSQLTLNTCLWIHCLTGLGQTTQEKFATDYKYSGVTYPGKESRNDDEPEEADDFNDFNDGLEADDDDYPCASSPIEFRSEMGDGYEPNSSCPQDENKEFPKLIASKLQQFGWMTTFQWLPNSKLCFRRCLYNLI